MTIRPALRSAFRYFAYCVIVFALHAPVSTFAQDRCGTVEFSSKLTQRRNVTETPQQFEEWLRTRPTVKQRPGSGNRPQTTTYQVPVVVHIVHNGETVGNGTNISDAQILSQIATLNRDYQRLNADAVNTPADFTSVAGAFDLEFVLAQQDPEGLATTGIVRVPGPKTQWTINDNYLLKSQSYWPAEDYLNLWVCNITDYLGYAQFPVSSLPGLENSSNNRLSDGVVIAYNAFGSVDDGPFNLDPQYNKGRTATHEIGHFFGLRHIWGDDGTACGNAGDYVADTPDQAGRTYNCPAHPAYSCTPAVMKMFQNYMDYTDDQCMNLFTQLQVARMTTVIENSPRRVSLLGSHGLDPPTPVANDAGIKAILAPTEITCDNTVTPVIEIRNYGSNAITSVRVQLKVNSVTKETTTETVNLAPLEATTITFNNIAITPGTADFTFTIIQTNGGTDGNAGNNIKSVTTDVPNIISAPFIEPFNTVPASWTITDPDNFITWTLVTAPSNQPTNKALKLNFYDYEDGEGEIDILTTPVIDLSSADLAVLYFDVAYAPFNAAQDGLEVYVLTDCGDNIYDGVRVYRKTGNTLGTTASTSTGFTPQSATDWRKEAVNLAAFIGNPHVQLAFVGLNDWGNNLYLDNIAVLTSPFEDIAVRSVTPGVITCESSPAFEVTVRNAGTISITSFDVRVQAEGKDAYTQSFSGVNLIAGQTTTVTLSPYALADGANTLTVEALNPNGNIDVNSEDNQLQTRLVVNDTRYSIPYRESFESGFGSDWTLVNPTNGLAWQTKDGLQHFGTSAWYNAFDNTNLGEEAWLISPVFDFSQAEEASLQFYSSYAVNSGRNDGLRVLYSTDCGNNFSPTPFFNKSGENLANNNTSTAAWTPQALSEWQHRVVDLTALAGNKNLRFAFVATNANGNNIYLDNINFSTTVEPNPLLNEQLYVIYSKTDEYDFYLTFNLPEKQSVQYEVVDTMGRRVVKGVVDDVLNQTYPVRLEDHESEGIYIVRLGIGARFYSTKIYLSR
jgi:hypothetical protein